MWLQFFLFQHSNHPHRKGHGKVYSVFLNTQCNLTPPTNILDESSQIRETHYYSHLNMFPGKFKHLYPGGGRLCFRIRALTDSLTVDWGNC